MHYLGAAMLVAVVVFTLFDTTRTLAHSIAKSSVPSTAMIVVNGVIFAMIIGEIIRTVLSRFDKGLQLQRLLVIGIVCAVRDVLSVGAHLALNNMVTPDTHTSLLELGINTGVVVGLATSFVLIRRYGPTMGEDEGLGEPSMVDGETC